MRLNPECIKLYAKPIVDGKEQAVESSITVYDTNVNDFMSWLKSRIGGGETTVSGKRDAEIIKGEIVDAIRKKEQPMKLNEICESVDFGYKRQGFAIKACSKLLMELVKEKKLIANGGLFDVNE